MRLRKKVPHSVIINGVKYIPEATIRPADDKQIKEALDPLFEILYFRQDQKAIGAIWMAIEALDPQFFKLAQEDLQAAYYHLNPPDEDD